MTMIAERPASVQSRLFPGHWEGDVILGSNCRSAIATLVERQSRYLLLVGLPNAHRAPAVRDALIDAFQQLPEHLRQTLTWDQGTELARHREIALATELQIYFCDPHSPWQRGSNENTNGLIRQYFPKGTDLSLHDQGRLAEIADELNHRPRKTLHMNTPAELRANLLSPAETTTLGTERVATTT
jgi:IS30 family transposase